MTYPYSNFQPYAPQQGYMGGYQPVQPAPVPTAQVQPAAPAVRFVTNKEEVVSSQIPFDGSTSYFSDTSNGKIYTKTFDFNTGTAPIVTYVREQEVKVQYATLDDLRALRDELMAKPKKAVKKDDADE